MHDVLEEVRNFFLKNISTDTPYSEVVDQYVTMKSYLEYGHSIDEMMLFHVEKSYQPTYYMRYLPYIYAQSERINKIHIFQFCCAHTIPCLLRPE